MLAPLPCPSGDSQAQGKYERAICTLLVAHSKGAVLSHTERRALIERTMDALWLVTQAELLSISRRSLYYQPSPPPLEIGFVLDAITQARACHPTDLEH
jgi:hypothetical protein